MKAMHIARKVGHTAIVKPSRTIYALIFLICVILVDVASMFYGYLASPCRHCAAEKGEQHIDAPADNQGLPVKGLLFFYA